mgnify:CR=1 FL=1
MLWVELLSVDNEEVQESFTQVDELRLVEIRRLDFFGKRLSRFEVLKSGVQVFYQGDDH